MRQQQQFVDAHIGSYIGAIIGGERGAIIRSHFSTKPGAFVGRDSGAVLGGIRGAIVRGEHDDRAR